MLKKHTFHFFINLGLNLIYISFLFVYILVIASFAMDWLNEVDDFKFKLFIILAVFGLFGFLIGVSHLFFNYTYQSIFTVRRKEVIPVVSYTFIYGMITFIVLNLLQLNSDTLLFIFVLGAAHSGYLIGKLIKQTPVLK